MQALAALGHEFRVLRTMPYRPWGALPDRYEYEGQRVKVIRALAPPRLYGLSLLRRQFDAAIEKEVRAFRPQLIHAHRILAAGYLAVDRNLPVVVTAHGGDAYATPYRRRGLREAARRVFSRATELVAVSAYIGEHMRRLGAERTTIVYNGADENRFFPRSREASRRRLEIDPARFVVSFVGNVVRAKGTNELAAALAALAGLRPMAIVAGAGANRDRMADALRRGGVEARFLGAVTHDTLADVYGAADAVALPSYAEGFPAVVCEAMLCGRAVVTTPVGGIPEIVNDGSNGMLVPPRDSAALAEALRHIARSQELKARLERQAYADARSRLTWNANARAYDTVYARAAAAS